MKEEKDQDMSILAYDTFSENKELEDYKKLFQFKHKAVVNNQFYLEYPDAKVLYSYLYFALHPQNPFSNEKIQNLLNKVPESKNNQPIYKKFNLNYNKDVQQQKDLTKLIFQKQNSITTNKKLLVDFSKCLTSKQQCITLIKSGLPKFVDIHFIDKQKNKNQVDLKGPAHVKNWVIILQGQKTNYLIFYYLGKGEQRKSLIRSSISSDQKQKIQEANQGFQTEIEPKNIQKKIQQQQDKKQKKSQKKPKDKSQIKQNQKKLSKQLKKFKSQIVQPQHASTQFTQSKLKKVVSDNPPAPPQPAQKQQSYEITWYQVIVIIIIIFAILSEYYNIFDDFLIKYNQNIGQYYLLELGYKIGRFLFGSWNSSDL